MLEAKYYIYILCNKNNNVLYTGVTDNICRRLLEHKLKNYDGFTKKYNVDKLVYYETFNDSHEASKRENKIKAGSRNKKLELVRKFNPNWHDLFAEVCT